MWGKCEPSRLGGLLLFNGDWHWAYGALLAPSGWEVLTSIKLNNTGCVTAKPLNISLIRNRLCANDYGALARVPKVAEPCYRFSTKRERFLKSWCFLQISFLTGPLSTLQVSRENWSLAVSFVCVCVCQHFFPPFSRGTQSVRLWESGWFCAARERLWACSTLSPPLLPPLFLTLSSLLPPSLPPAAVFQS